jgi:sensor histidine kinase YesM
MFNLYLNNNNYEITDHFNKTMANYYAINQLLILSNENKEAISFYLRELNPEDKIRYEKSKKEIEELMNQLFDSFHTLETHFLLNAINNSSEAYNLLWNQAIDEREAQVDSYFNQYYRGESIQAYTEKYIEDLLYTSLGEGTELYKQLAKEAELMRGVSFLLIVGVMFFAMFIGFILSNALVRPIKKLADASKKISSGNLDVELIESDSEDEVGVLTDTFNIMSRSIKKYVTDLEQKVIIEKKLHEEELEVIRMEQLVKEAKFNALQSQINPHFLFNTLNTISRTAMFEEAQTTQTLIQALSNLFRYKLRNDSGLIPIEEELDIIKEYFYLQQMRFNERLTFTIKIDETSRGILIPIFSLQPLVENAIIHGIEPKIKGGMVTVAVSSGLSNMNLYTSIKVSDTGVGMSKERLEEVKNFELLSQHSIGVGNVYHRFMLTYGNGTEFYIQSQQDEGTCIEVRFLVKKGLEEGESENIDEQGDLL